MAKAEKSVKDNGEAEEQEAAPNKTNKWASMLEDLKRSSGGGPFFFIKNGKTQIHLLAEEGTEDDFFVEVTEGRFGKPKPKYIVLGVVMRVDTGELSERWQNKVAPIVIPKTVMSSILNLLAEGYDLLDPDTGHGITIRRTGEGFNTEYTVTPSPKPVPLPEELIAPDHTLEELITVYAERPTGNQQGESAGSADMGDGGW